ncbi:hypothetical protein BDZ89DRAFT_772505 [Hymenopellis radicata]|nr:hypothetical protein BDZ89DRAFT_772505 [Hymenopellis radicata]
MSTNSKRPPCSTTFHNILPNIDKYISSISAKIRSLQDVIASLQQERDALENVRERYRGLISLCRGVPPEVWERILFYVHEDEQIDDEEFTVSNRTCSIWDMAKVCQTWRVVAVSLHSCWTKLRLEFPEDGKTERDVWALEVALQRSGQHPLDITLISGYIPDDFDPSFRDRMLTMVHAESHRWRDARLSEYDMNSDIAYAPLRGRLPMLESLNLFLSGEFDTDSPVDEQSVLTVFDDCPRLTKVVLTGTQLVELPWAQIRELRLEDICRIWVEEACRQFVSLVGRCANLQVLQARAFEVEENPPPSSTICPSMRVLDMAIDYVIDRLTLPRLQEVILSKDAHNPHTDTLRSFHRLLQRSECASNITSLQIRDIPLYGTHHSAHDFYAILSEMTHLVVLDIQGSMKCVDYESADNMAMEQITKVLGALSVASQDIVTFLPRLSSLDIDLKHHMHRGFPYFGSTGGLVSMLKARWEGDDMRGLAKLKRFQFSLSALERYLGWRLCGDADEIGVFTEGEGRILQDLVMDGMDVAIKVRSVDSTTTVQSKVAQQVPGER